MAGADQRVLAGGYETTNLVCGFQEISNRVAFLLLPPIEVA